MKNRQGQAMIILLVILPLLLLIFGLIVRSGGTALAHDHIENHCNKKILDALEVQGRALSVLGAINPVARTIITSRRAIDPLVAAGVVYLVPVQQALFRAQSFVARAQNLIEKESTVQSLLILKSSTPKQFEGKMSESYKPLNPTLHIEPEKLYQNEEGPPLQPEDDFSTKQSASGSIKIFTEKFLSPWPKNPKARDMNLQCLANISMDRLEGKWIAQIAKPKVKP